MREFALINANGIRYDLNNGKSFFHEPSGLGFEYKNNYENINNCFVLTQSEIKQLKVKGKINFTGYEAYYEFAKFIQFTPLRLEYLSYKTFYTDCTVESIEKTELEGMGLSCPVEIVGQSPFYELVTIKNENDIMGKIYPYVYPYSYSDSDTGTIKLKIDTNIKSGVIFNILGPCINPTWSHYVNGIKRISGKVNAKIENENRLVIDTTALPNYSILEKDLFENVVKDRYADSDFTTDRFILLEHGENIITCTHEGTEKIKVIMEAHIYHDTV